MRYSILAACVFVLAVATSVSAKPKPPVTLTIHGRPSEVLANLSRELFAGGCVVTTTSPQIVTGKRKAYMYTFLLAASDSASTTVSGQCFVDAMNPEWPPVNQTGNKHQRDELAGFIERAAQPDTSATTPHP